MSAVPAPPAESAKPDPMTARVEALADRDSANLPPPSPATAARVAAVLDEIGCTAVTANTA